MSSEEPLASISATGISGASVRVEFSRESDRYSHSIELLSGDDSVMVMQSVEGQPDSLFPCSPCLTQLHEQSGDLFLTGATSACYWSMSVSRGTVRMKDNLDVEVLTRLKNRQGYSAPQQVSETRHLFDFLSFEVACRVKKQGELQGSQYRCSESFHMARGVPRPYAILVDQSRDKLGFVHMGADPEIINPALEFVPRPQCILTSDEDHSIRVEPVDDKLGALPATIQWRYGVWVL